MERYNRIATFMSRRPEMAMFRGFKMLNAQNLLYLQAELTEMELDLIALMKRDREAADVSARQIYHQNWYYLSKSKRDGDDAQWQKTLEIRAKLEEYNRCLAQFTVLCNQESPGKSNLKFLNWWLQHKDMGNDPLRGSDMNIWEDAGTVSDLVAIRSGVASDMFSQFFVLRILPVFHRLVGRHFKACTYSLQHRLFCVFDDVLIVLLEQKPAEDLAENGRLTEYSDANVLAVVEVLNIIIACLLPLSSIIILYCVSSLPVRLGIVVAYVVLFSLCLALFTRARRVEIFAGVAGFAAVQVVFISATIVKVKV